MRKIISLAAKAAKLESKETEGIFFLSQTQRIYNLFPIFLLPRTAEGCNLISKLIKPAASGLVSSFGKVCVQPARVSNSRSPDKSNSHLSNSVCECSHESRVSEC